MKRVLAVDLGKHENAEVCVRGWLHNVRKLGKIGFVVLRDRTGLIQIVIEDKELLTKVAAVHIGSVLRVTGTVVSSNNAALGREIIKASVEIESEVKEPPPIEYYKPEINADIDFILDNRPLALRNERIQAVFRIQSELAHAYRLYMHDVVGAVEYFAPNMLGASSEGGTEFFNVDYFGYPATLAQSSQLYKQMMVGSYERVFALMPFFRAENSNTSRHLTEGKQLEFEMGFFENWRELLDIEEGYLKFMMERLQKECANELAIFGESVVKIPSNVPFPRVTFEEAQEIYFKRTGIDERAEKDLSPNAERELCAYALDEFGTECIFVTDWQLEKRPFYSYPNETRPELTNTFDLLCAGVEITSGGQRRHTYESMLTGLELKGLNASNFGDYLSIFKFGMPPHGGFGIGLERLTMTILRLKNVREASLFPSDPKRIAGVRLKQNIFFGGENIRNEIVRLLRKADVEFQHCTHEETKTSEDSARVRGTALEEGVKAIILRGKTSKKNIQINLPSHQKLNMKAVAELAGEKFEFEDAAVIEARYGLKVGSVPPFGHLINLETWFDQGIFEREVAAFNCGLTTDSIVMKSKDIARIAEVKTAQVAA